MDKKISIVIPCYNEEGNISVLVDKIFSITHHLEYDFELIFIDDGSKDNTIKEIQNQCLRHINIFYVELSRNFGKDQALRAGLAVANGDAVITMDADLQHPPSLITKLVNYWEEGFEVIYTYRETNNPHVSWYQKLFSKAYYKVMNFLSSIELEEGISDFRLMDRKVLKSLNLIIEQDIFFRGIIKWVGYQQIGIPYTPDKRENGEVSYSIFRLVKLAVSSVLSFSVKPLIIATFMGVIFAFLAVLLAPYIIISYLLGYAVSGWTSLITTIVFFGGLQLFILGVISLYLSKLYLQSKHRPNYLIRKTNYLNISNDSVKF
ncbi:MAG: glycosyltransferase [Sphingobacteriales bacterium]|nr:glycosyltransferase [Sphingobacteriales bacterium]